MYHLREHASKLDLQQERLQRSLDRAIAKREIVILKACLFSVTAPGRVLHALPALLLQFWVDFLRPDSAVRCAACKKDRRRKQRQRVTPCHPVHCRLRCCVLTMQRYRAILIGRLSVLRQGMALNEKRASGALEAVQRQALTAIQRTAGEVAKSRVAADQKLGDLRGRQQGLEAEAAGVDAEISGLQHEEEALRVAVAGAVRDKYRVGFLSCCTSFRYPVVPGHSSALRRHGQQPES